MTCIRGKASPNQFTKLRLFAAAAGYCQNPACNDPIFKEIGKTNFHIAEMAHIFAVGKKGPRANNELTSEQKGHFDNLILLCPSCHRTVDKAPSEFPDSLIVEWKSIHQAKIETVFGAIEYSNRRDARTQIDPLLAENRAIFDEYGPDNEYKDNPESEMALVWQRKVKSQILPNNRIILSILDKNRKMLEKAELNTLEHFRQHVKDQEIRHLTDISVEHSKLFPAGMNDIFCERDN